MMALLGRAQADAVGFLVSKLGFDFSPGQGDTTALGAGWSRWL